MKLGVTLFLLVGCGPAFTAATAEPDILRPDADPPAVDSSADGAPATDSADSGGAESGGEDSGGERDAAAERAEAQAEACASVLHSDGIGDSWSDCVPAGTHNAEQALRACESAHAGPCQAIDCGGDAGAEAVCNACACWTFAGPYGAGSVFESACADAGVQQHCGGGVVWD